MNTNLFHFVILRGSRLKQKGGWYSFRLRIICRTFCESCYRLVLRTGGESYKALTLIYSFQQEMAPPACIIQIRRDNQANKIRESDCEQSWLRYEVPNRLPVDAFCFAVWFVTSELRRNNARRKKKSASHTICRMTALLFFKKAQPMKSCGKPCPTVFFTTLRVTMWRSLYF